MKAPSHPALQKLSSEERAALASSQETPLKIRLLLLEDPYRKVRRAAERSIDILQEPEELIRLAEGRYPEGRRVAARSPHTPRETLERLWRAGASRDLSARDHSPEALSLSELMALAKGGPFAQMLAASYPDLPADLFWDLFRTSQFPGVMRALCQNPATPGALLCQLATQRQGRLKAEVARHPALPPTLQAALAEAKPCAVRISLASNPNTSSALLLKLAKDPALQVRRALLKNPATPREALFAVGTLDPQGLLQNPVFPLLQLEAPDFFYEMPTKLLFKLAALPSPPRALVDWSLSIYEGGPLHYRSQWEDLWTVLLQNKGAPLYFLRRMLHGDLSRLRRLAAAHPACPPEDLALLMRAGTTPEMERGAAPDLTLEPEALEVLAERGSFGRELAAAHPNTPLPLRIKLSQDPSPEVQAAAVSSPKLPTEYLEALAKNPAHAVQDAMLRREDAPGAFLLLVLRTSYSLLFRQRAAEHPKAPLEEFTELSEESFWEDPLRKVQNGNVALVIARRPSLSPVVAERLARHAPNPIRCALAARTDLGPEIFALLAELGDKTVRAVLANNPAFLRGSKP